MAIDPFAEIGRTGLTRFGGYIQEEWLPELIGSRGARVYRKMATNDALCGAMMFAVKAIIRRVSWSAEAGGPTYEDQNARDFLNSCFFDMSSTWSDTISEILSMLVYGWSYFELVYKRRLGPDQKSSSKRSRHSDGRIGWRKWAIRGQDTLSEWLFDDDGTLAGMVQMPPPDYGTYTIPIQKALLFRTSSAKGNPEGESVLRPAYRSWYMKTNLEDIEAIGCERDLAGLPIIYVPTSILEHKTAETADAYAYYTAMVSNLRRDTQEGVLLPSETDERGNRKYELKLLGSSGQRQFNTSQIINRYETRMAMTLMADFLLLGTGRQGSYALASTKTDLFTTALISILDNIQDVINTHAVPRLFAYNTFDVEDLPHVVHGEIKVPDLTAIGDFLNKMSFSGAQLFPDTRLENHLRSLVGVPPKSLDETIPVENPPYGVSGPGSGRADLSEEEA